MLLIIDSDAQALNLLASLISSGNTTTPPLPAAVPPPHHLAFAATLAIHPTLTTRASSQDRADAASLALWYLRLVLQVVGPINSNFYDAFVFTGIGIRCGTGRRHVTRDGASSSGDDLENISNDLAETGAIWTRAEDFWQVAGWAFNCSVLHRKRWASWKLWLDFLIDVLEKDWEARGVGFGEDGALNEGEHDPRENSIIVRSLTSGDGTTGKERRVVRAVFADGGSRAAGEFTEIWKNETKERKRDTEHKRITRKIDFAADDYGDYMDEDRESDLEDSDSDPKDNYPRAPESTSNANLPDLSEPLGGIEAINLRLRLLSLLSTVSIVLAHKFIILDNLLDLYREHIRPLPPPTFFTLMSPIQLRHFPAETASLFIKYILGSLIAASAPLPTEDTLSQETVESCYLPFAANTSSIADNAKVSLCVEALLRIIDWHGQLSWTPTLQEAAEAGIDAREKKARNAGRKKARGIEHDRSWLTNSANRIRSVVQMARPK